MTNKMNNMKSLQGKYYVIPSGWKGMAYENCIKAAEWMAVHGSDEMSGGTVHNSYESAMQEIDRLWNEELADDECAYLIYPDGQIDER